RFSFAGAGKNCMGLSGQIFINYSELNPVINNHANFQCIELQFDDSWTNSSLLGLIRKITHINNLPSILPDDNYAVFIVQFDNGNTCRRMLTLYPVLQSVQG